MTPRADSRPALCVMCGESLTPREARTRLTCSRSRCVRGLHTARNRGAQPSRSLPFWPSHSPGSCVVCHWPVTPAAFVESGGTAATAVCGKQNCRAAVAPEAPEVAAERARELATLQVQAEALRDTARADEAADTPVFFLPSYSKPIGPLPEKRRQAFRDYLERVVAGATHEMDKATAEPGPDLETESTAGPAPPSSTLTKTESDTLLGSACGVCRGYCCATGGDKAYLRVKDLEIFRTAHPTLEPAEVVSVYVDRLPDESYVGSCVFHIATGCSLGELRSAICHRYLCPALKRIQRSELREAFAVATSCKSFETAFGEQILRAPMVRAGFISTTGLRLATVPGVDE